MRVIKVKEFSQWICVLNSNWSIYYNYDSINKYYQIKKKEGDNYDT